MPRHVRFLFADGDVSLGVACGGNGGQQAGPVAGRPAARMPPMPVEIVTLTAKPVEQTSEFVASLKSRRSTTIQPEVEGFITRIAVRSGQRVDRGRAAVRDRFGAGAGGARRRCSRCGRCASPTWNSRGSRSSATRRCLTAGAISQREVEQFEAQLRAAEAQLKALDEQIRQQRSQLNYYRVTAPNAGTVGDVPVNAGDRVTRSTVLTTVDENDVLEVYINVPVQQAPQLKVGLPVRLMDDRGQLLDDQQDHLRLSERRHRDAVGAGEGAAGRRPRPVPVGSIRARAQSCGRRRRG